jgi:hypothetical protein
MVLSIGRLRILRSDLYAVSVSPNRALVPMQTFESNILGFKAPAPFSSISFSLIRKLSLIRANTTLSSGLSSSNGYQSLHVKNPDHRATTFGLIRQGRTCCDGETWFFSPE